MEGSMNCNLNVRHISITTGIAAVIALCLTSLAPRMAVADDKVPNLNIAPSCRYQSRMQPDQQVGFEKCMEQEKNAKEQLEKTWAQYTPQDRTRCIDMTNDL